METGKPFKPGNGQYVFMEDNKKMRSQNKKIEPQSIVSLLKKEDMQRGIDAYYVSTCYGDSPTKGGTAFYARILYEKYVLREIIIKTQHLIILIFIG